MNPTSQIGIAISTTGDPHRLRFLETCVQAWTTAMPSDALIFITVDGDPPAVQRVVDTLGPSFRTNVHQAGRRIDDPEALRVGVAATKNTGLELLMDACEGVPYPSVEHFYLSDDDTWPTDPAALALHKDSILPHSMVCWGKGRLSRERRNWSEWTWPRGVMLYTRRSVIVEVGGMDERYGPGGHEHADWSRRIHQAGLTPAPFVTPTRYAYRTRAGFATGASTLWNCEDMPGIGESPSAHRLRKRQQSSIRREGTDWDRINALYKANDGDTRFIPFRAADNGRRAATMSQNLTSLGAEGDDR
jgi:hypothetical protein